MLLTIAPDGASTTELCPGRNRIGTSDEQGSGLKVRSDPSVFSADLPRASPADLDPAEAPRGSLSAALGFARPRADQKHAAAPPQRSTLEIRIGVQDRLWIYQRD
jgi:hypothetical protein